MQINNSYSVLTPVASGADVSVTGVMLNITGIPSMDIRKIENLGVGNMLDPITEKAAIWTITPPATPTASATYGYTVRQKAVFTQVIPGQANVLGYNYITAANPHTVSSGGETKVVMMQAMEKGLLRYTDPAYGLKLTSSVDGTSGVETITATAGSGLLEVIDNNIPPAAWGSAIAQTKVTKAVSASTNATPTVITFATLSGSVIDYSVVGTIYLVNITAATGGSGISAGYYLAALTAATTAELYTLAGAPVAGTATSDVTGNVVFAMQESRGAVADLLRMGVDSSLLTTGHVYGEVIFNFTQDEAGGNDFPSLTRSVRLFVDYTANNTYYRSFVAALRTAVGSLYSY